MGGPGQAGGPYALKRSEIPKPDHELTMRRSGLWPHNGGLWAGELILLRTTFLCRETASQLVQVKKGKS